MENSNKKIITRMAPSPTGLFHVGSVRTALYNWLYARQNGGEFILRIEDTDKERSKKEFEENITDAFDWLGLTYDAFYRQSERTDIYKKYIEKMIEGGFAYVSKEEPKEEGQRSEVIRFKNPNKVVTFSDVVLGEISVDTTDLGDFVIARDMENPLYHLTVVIDDFDMGITHVIRGQDHVSNTPRQILIQEAVGAPRPVYAHIPLILSPDKSKLSKRHGALGTTEYRDIGYLPEGIINFMALIGWNPGTDEEVFTLEELVEKFKLEKVQKGGGVFNIEKLNWINREHIKRMSEESFRNEALKYIPAQLEEDTLLKILPILKERIEKFSDIKNLFDEGEFDYFITEPIYVAEKLFFPNSKIEENLKKQAVLKNLKTIHEKLCEVDSFNQENVKNAIWDFATEAGRGDVLWPLRFALSGRDKSPDPFTLCELLGKEKTLERIKSAILKLE